MRKKPYSLSCTVFMLFLKRLFDWLKYNIDNSARYDD